MEATNTAPAPATDPIAEVIAKFQPKVPLPGDLLADLKQLVAAMPPHSPHEARCHLSNASKFLHAYQWMHGRPLGQILTHERVEHWANAQRTEKRPSRTVSNERGRLTNLADTLAGVARRARSTDPERVGPRHSIDPSWTAMLTDPTVPDGVRATLIIGFGCGTRHTAGARTEPDGTVTFPDGTSRLLPPDLTALAIELAGTVAPAGGWIQATRSHPSHAKAPSEPAIAEKRLWSLAQANICLVDLVGDHGFTETNIDRIARSPLGQPDLDLLRG